MKSSVTKEQVQQQREEQGHEEQKQQQDESSPGRYKSGRNSKIRSIGGIDGGEVARRGEVGSRPALSLLLQIVSA